MLKYTEIIGNKRYKDLREKKWTKTEKKLYKLYNEYFFVIDFYSSLATPES